MTKLPGPTHPKSQARLAANAEKRLAGTSGPTYGANMGVGPINLYLDDLRAVPDGWVLVKTIAAAKEQLKTGKVIKASLDHDLGACETCMAGRTVNQWLEATNWEEMPNCTHFGTGYDLVKWMEKTGHWPKEKPTVHSANPKGRKRMQEVIDRNWPVVSVWRETFKDEPEMAWENLTSKAREHFVKRHYG